MNVNANNIKQEAEVAPIRFVSNMESRFVSTMRLKEEISDMFKSILGEDYYGCTINVIDGRKVYDSAGNAMPNFIEEEFKRGFDMIGDKNNKKQRFFPKGIGTLYVDIILKYNGYSVDNYIKLVENATDEAAIDAILQTELADYHRRCVLSIAAIQERNSFLDFANKKKNELNDIKEGKKAPVSTTANATSAAPVEKKVHNIVERYNRMNDRNRKIGKSYEVLRHTFEMLEPFMPTEFNTNWNLHTIESIDNLSMYGTREETTIRVLGLDLDKIVKHMYGEEIKNVVYEYKTFPSTVIANRINEFIVTINKLEADAYKELIDSISVYSVTNMNGYLRV